MDDKYLKYQAVNSPSKIDQWCKPKPAAKLVLALVRRSPLMLKERAGGSMTNAIFLYHIDIQLFFVRHVTHGNSHFVGTRRALSARAGIW